MGWSFFSILIWAVASSAYTYPTPVDFSGKISRWEITLDDPIVTYEVRADSSYDEAYLGSFVDEAANIWSQVSGSYILLRPAPANERADITVNFKSSLSGQAFSSGFAIFDEMSESGYPTHCSISILVSGRLITIQKTVLHELGHCLGLGHTLVPEAIMSYSLDKNTYALDTDDRAALSRIYPADGSEPQLPPGCATPYWLGKTKTGIWLLLVLLCPPFLTMLLWHKRKRGSFDPRLE